MRLIIILIVVILIGFSVKTNIINSRNKKAFTDLTVRLNKSDSINNIILIKMNRIMSTDSARNEHYRTCSFISNDDVGVGFRGFLYSKQYKRNQGGQPGTK